MVNKDLEQIIDDIKGFKVSGEEAIVSCILRNNGTAATTIKGEVGEILYTLAVIVNRISELHEVSAETTLSAILMTIEEINKYKKENEDEN